MIHGITANHKSFHSVRFGPGLNVILADRTATSMQKDTRNGVGKSTLIEIIHFCLGSQSRKGKGLKIDSLKGWVFTLEITLAGKRVKVSRAIDTPNRFVISGDTTGWIEQPDVDKSRGEYTFKPDRWNDFLGWALFGVVNTDDPLKYRPRYRSLISYFLRRGIDAYANPFDHTRHQKPWDSQLHAGFLLGLNWESVSKWQELKDQERGIKAIDTAIKTGVMGGVHKTVGELEAEEVQLEEQVKEESTALQNFKVHPQYEAIQNEADQVTAEIHQLTNENISDNRRLRRYKESVTSEKPPLDIAIDRLYEETGVIFPDSVRRTLAEAKEFHFKIVENRRSFLGKEIKRLERQIEQRNNRIKQLTESRAASLEILNTHGALQEMTKLQEHHVETCGKLDRVRTNISDLKDLTARKREIKVHRTEFVEIAEQDHEQRRSIWSVAMRLFNENSKALYETSGSLVIDITETGFKYDVEIEKSGSEGIGKMKIFCFDLMLLQLMAQQEDRIDFLVHDSILYDGVDERQRALALERASKIANQTGTQYICALNSDIIPHNEFSEDFDFKQHIRLTLTDEDPSKSLLGIQF